VVGEIEDEFDIPAAPQPVLDEDTALTLDGSLNIRDLESQYQLILPRDAGFETLAGFVLNRLQKIPRVGDAFEFEGRRYTVEEMEAHRIARVKIENLHLALEQAGD
jgi:putative hemolysin